MASSSSVLSIMPQTDVPLDDYLTIVPRGFQDIVQDLLPLQIRQASKDIHVVVENLVVVGEDPDNYDSAHLLDLKDRLLQATEKKHEKKRQRLNPEDQARIPTVGTLTKFPYGNIYDPQTKRHVGLGMDQDYAAKSDKLLHCLPGGNTGTVWLRFSTNASPQSVASCRCIGPLLALVQVYQASQEATHENRTAMNQVIQDLQQATESVDWQKPLSLWQRHLRPHQQEESLFDSTILKYRCSCVRNDSKKYPYPRHELLQHAAKYMAPPNNIWQVDLTHFDMEFVWFYRPWESAIGISARNYAAVGAMTFSHGDALPPDITPPYLQGDLLKDTIRLRPTTAQLLLHMAHLQSGDVVVDPCVGMGTIVMECLHQPVSPLFAWGGDLELKDANFRAKAVAYENSTRTYLAKQQVPMRSQASLFAWDATTMPLGVASVDAIVSDLPFGRSCLSSNLLAELVPLLLDEFARVLRPSTGRMVLLCGNPQVLLDGLRHANQDSSDKGGQDTAGNLVLWELPLSTCRPVNIGGHMVWILRVQRGSRPRPNQTSHSESLRKYYSKRDQRRTLPQR